MTPAAEVLELALALQPAVRLTMRCRDCGCSELEPCLVIVPELQVLSPCWWVEPDLCCACVGDQTGVVEVVGL